MSDELIFEPGSEPERYELDAGSKYRFELLRRDFFKMVGAGAIVFSVASRLASASTTAQDPARRRRQARGSLPAEISAWLHIDEHGLVTVYTGKVEVGQDIRTSLSQTVADELRVPLATVTMVMADTARTPYDRGTFGSQSIPVMASQLRRVAAAARQLLVEQAAEEWGVDPVDVEVSDAVLRHHGKKREASYGELTRGKQLLQTVAAEIEPTAAKDWKVAGRTVPRVTGLAIVTGSHQYTPDLSRPGMLQGKVLRPPAFGAELMSCDISEAKTVKGVTIVVDGNFIGAAAENTRLASRTLAKVKPVWRKIEHPSDEDLFAYLKDNQRARGTGRRRAPYQKGSIEEGLAAASHELSSRYTCAYIAHAPMEPRAALAEWHDGELAVWTGTQRPFGVRTELADAFRLAEEKVRVVVPDTGSCYGGKHSGEAAVEAARLAKAAGRPVKIVWTREEEFTWAYFRPAGVIEVRAGVDDEGLLTAWEFHNFNSGGSAIRTLYEVPHQHIEYHATRAPLRQGSYRGLAATANHFARESVMDELAYALDQDPLAFRLQNLTDERLIAVLEAAAERFAWNRRQSREGVGYGIAGGFEKGGYVASCVEISIHDDVPELRRVVTAFECGAIVNPDGLKQQVVGAVIMGLGGALFEAIAFSDGRILNPRFSQYRVPRFSDIPEMDTVLINRKDLPSAGAGEAPIVAVAPAIGNAIFDATGQRRRALPMT